MGSSVPLWLTKSYTGLLYQLVKQQKLMYGKIKFPLQQSIADQKKKNCIYKGNKRCQYWISSKNKIST